jgi:N-acetylmuramoyl-L-alanine amidase
MLVLHYTGMPDRAQALARLCDRAAEVSAHYLIDEDGACYQLVAEDKRAWHAGRSSWRGQTDINARSIGIELVNPGHEFGYRPFPQRQMTALAALARDILARHPIPARNVVGHADIAPRRKEDPGELFDWEGLSRQGIGLWPILPVAVQEQDWRQCLARIGYDLGGTGDEDAARLALTAFQRHFRPTRFDGSIDAETLQRLQALCAMLPENL